MTTDPQQPTGQNQAPGGQGCPDLDSGTRQRYFNTRREHPRYPAHLALSEARLATFIDENTEEVDTGLLSLDGRVRVRFEPDEWVEYDNLAGDCFNPQHMGKLSGGLRTLRAQEKAFKARLEDEGVWGFIVERRCPQCNEWQGLDSCWGFDGEPYQGAYADSLVSAIQEVTL